MIIDSGALSILVADDQPSIYDFVQMQLGDLQDIEIAYVQTIPDLHREISSRQYDLLLLDVHFPEGNALNEIPTIRRTCPSTCIVPLTVEGDPDFIAIHSSMGVDGWIPKGTHAGKRLFLTVQRFRTERGLNPSFVYCLASHIPHVCVSFHSTQEPLSRVQKECLYRVITSLPYSPDRHALSVFADQMHISPTSIVKFMKRRKLPSLSRLHRTLCAALAIALQWTNSELSLEQITEMVSNYAAGALNRAVRKLFHTTLPAVRNLRNIEALSSQRPLPVRFIHQESSRGRSVESYQIIIQVELD